MGLLGCSDLIQLDCPVNYTIPTTIVFLPLQGHAQTAVAQTYPWRLTHPPHPLPYLLPYTVRRTSATLTTPQAARHINKMSLAICWETWPLLYAEVQVYIILLNTNVLSSCLFLKVSSPHLFFCLFSSLCRLS